MKIETYARTAALFLTIVLLVGLYARHNEVSSAGYYFYLLEDPPPPANCYEGDGRPVILFMTPDGNMTINQDNTSDQEFAQQIAMIFRTRAEKIIFIRAELGLDFQTFITRVDTLKDAVPDLHFILLTPSWPQGHCSLRIRNPRLMKFDSTDVPRRGDWPRELEPPELHSR